jgi:3-phosphoshikimate 1-carboxyvinyltransferase
VSARTFSPAGALSGSLTPPPDKSISHRAAILSTMATGTSTISGYLDSADTRSTLAAVKALGAKIEATARPAGSLDIELEGIGLAGPARGAEAAPLAIDVGNSGTLMRLLPGWLAGQRAGSWSLDGDESIRRRPVDRIAEPLRRMGADVAAREDRLPPVEVRGASLRGIEYEMPVASAQVKSCLLFAGLMAEGPTTVVERDRSRDHTERMLHAAGAKVRVETEGSGLTLEGRLPGRRVSVEPADSLAPSNLAVPGDFSSAAFFVVGALLVPGSRIELTGVGLNPTRVGLLGILNRMGARIEVTEMPAVGGEPRGTVMSRHSPLHATHVGAGEVPLAIDELPLVALAAAFAEGETVVSGAGELRHKESDRVATVVEAIIRMGGDAEALEDGFAVRGTGGLRGGKISSYGDHRLAMVGALAGLASHDGVEVEGVEAAAVSYPGFENDLASLIGD